MSGPKAVETVSTSLLTVGSVGDAVGWLSLVGIAALIALSGPALLAAALLEYRLAWTVWRTPTADAGEARLSPSDGYVEVVGTVQPHETVETPVQGRECVAYEHEVEEIQGTGRNRSWQTVDGETEAVGFYVYDGSGRVYVSPGDPGEHEVTGNAELRLTEEKVTRVDGGEEPPEDVARYLARNEILDCQDDTLELGPIELPKGNDRRYRESALEPGDDVYVLGEVVQADGEAPEALALTDGPNTPSCLVSDRQSARSVVLGSTKKATGELAVGLALLAVTYVFIYPPAVEWFSQML